jgi:ATP P2X receptor
VSVTYFGVCARVLHVAKQFMANWLFFAISLLFMIRFVIWWKRGYQEMEPATSATTTKLKGIAALNYSYFNVSIHGGANGMRIWDVADYVVPPQV